jgi:hypothetical protein
VVGFYLLNLGYVALAMRTGAAVVDATAAVETLATKLGLVMLALGAIHFFNIFVLTRFRKRIQRQNLAELVPPHLPPGRPRPPMPPMPPAPPAVAPPQRPIPPQ